MPRTPKYNFQGQIICLKTINNKKIKEGIKKNMRNKTIVCNNWHLFCHCTKAIKVKILKGIKYYIENILLS